MALLGTLGAISAPLPAFAAGTVLFQNAFTNRTVDGTGTVTVPTPVSGPNVACLTASGNTTTGPLRSCSGASDAQGVGKLRLTNSTASQVGGVFGAGSFPTSNGLDVTFTAYQWGGGAADGIAFLLAAVDPANPVPPAVLGSSGGALGYSAAPGLNGLTNAYLGVGLDVFGNFSSSSYSGTGCPAVAHIGTATPGAVVVRGPGSARVGYCGLATTSDGTAGSKAILRATTRAASAVPVQVLINPTAAAFVSDSGVSVAAGSYKVVVKPVGQATETLAGPLPAAPAGLYPSSTWSNANGVPKQLAFGFVGSTGSVTDVHEISNAKVLTFDPVPQLAVATTSYAAAASTPGDPVTYRTTASVLAGANAAAPISVTQSVPVGVVPLGAFGSGWTCAAPQGRSITCTTTGSSFAAGTVLPVITTVAIVTGSSVAATLVQSSSPAQASSADAKPGAAVTTTAGTLPIRPGSLVATPALGLIAGGGSVTITGTDITSATAIEIGTASEMQAGTPVTLLPCPGAAAPGCFKVSGSTLVISSMPSRPAAAPTSITVVTAGTAAAAAYTYADKPAAPAAPTAVAGTASAAVTWVAPAANGNPITGYVVTPYRNGVAQAPQSYGASTTTQTLSGLTAGATYTFAVAATNGYGTSPASVRSNAVVPYVLPGAPTITATTAGSSSATLTWTTPGSGGGTISGYVVTPYVGTAAQAPQAFAATSTTQTVTDLTPGTAYTFSVAAVNEAGTGPASARSPAVTPNRSPSLTFPPPPAGEVGVAYAHPLPVVDGTAPHTWSISAGALPAGLTLNATSGLLGGTPTAAGSTSATIRVVDASGLVATRAITLVIAAAPTLSFTPAAGEVGVPYAQQPTVTGGTGPFAWTVTAGSLPAGIALSATTGALSGTPTAAGTSSVTIAATDAFGQAAAKTTSIVIVAQPSIGTVALPPGQVGVAYSSTLAVNGGTLPLAWAITSGSLSPGLTLGAASGAVTGTPTTAGTSPVTVTVTDANGQTATRSLTLVVAAGPLVITKTASASSTTSDATVGFTITVANTGPTAITGVVLDDPLGAVLDDAAYAGGGSATAGTLTYASSKLRWEGSVPGSGSVTITYAVVVDSPVLGDQVLTNTVTSSTLGTNCADGSADPRCTAVVKVAGLTIVKTADVASATPGSLVAVRVVITNTGQAVLSGASFADDLTGMLDDATYLADAATTAGSVTYTRPTLTWTGTLAVGGQATITYTVRVADPDQGDRSLAGTVVSPTPGSPCPSTAPAPSCSVAVPVLVPALSITSHASAAIAEPGSTVAYTVVLANTGQTPATATSVAIELGAALDDATYTGGASATAGAVSYDPATSSLTWTGNLAIGATATITAELTVRDPDPGDRVLTTVVRSSAPGSSCPPDPTAAACTTTVLVRVPALLLLASTDGATTTPGSVVRHRVTATNTGQTSYSAATFRVAMDGVVDDAAYGGDAAATTGTVSLTGSDLVWIGALAVGATTTVTWTTVVDDPDEGDLTLLTRVTSATAGASCPPAGTDPRCSSSVAVLVPDLTVTTEADAPGGTTTPGSVVHYTVTVANTGQSAYAGLAVTLDLSGALDDADYDYDAAITTGDLVPQPDGTVDWVLDLAPGATAVGTISVTVKDPAPGDRSLEVVVVSDDPGSPCRTGTPADGCRSVVSVLVPGLTITKTANAPTVVPGGTVDYTITVTNEGETAQPTASFTDDLALVLTDATYDGGATATTGSVSSTATSIAWTGALAVGGSATIAYSVTVRDPDPGDKTMINSVTSSTAGSNCPAGAADPRCTTTVRVLVPGLTITNAVGATTTEPGAVVDHTITITNSGATPQDGASVSDDLSGLLDDATYDGNATVASGPGTVALVGSALVWSGDLPVGGVATITFSVTVRAADVGDDRLVDTISSSATGANCTIGGTDPRCTATVPVARLVLVQAYEQTTATPGSPLRLTATFTNTGAVPYVAVTVSSASADTIDDATPTGDQTATSGTLVLSPTAITWTGNIPVDGVVTVTGTLTVQDPDLGDRSITGTLVSSAPGNNCAPGGDDVRCTALVTVVVPQLTITKVATSTETVPGGTVGYTITVHNSGQTAYTAAAFSDPLTGVVGNADYAGDATATSGTVTYEAATVAWTGDLAVGATAIVTYSVTVRASLTGEATLFNPVRSTTVGSTCPPATGNAACYSSVDILTPRLTITHAADHPAATLGSTVTGSIVVADTGQTSYPAASVSVDLTDVLDDATLDVGSADATSGLVDVVDGTLTWTGALAPGEEVTITYAVTIDSPSSGDLALAATATSGAAGSNCAPESGDPRCTATVAVINSSSLTFRKQADVTSTVGGATVAYTLLITNASDADIADATVTDPLVGILDDAAYGEDAAATGGSVTLDGPDLTWAGTVPALGSVTVTYTVTVGDQLAGDELLTGTIRSSTIADSHNCGPGAGDPRCTSTVPVAALVVEQQAAETTATPGSLVHLTTTYVNRGQVAYLDTSISSPRSDTSDDALPSGEQTATSGILVRTPEALTWTGNIPVGGEVTVIRSLRVRDPNTGNGQITATLSTTAAGSNCGAGSTDPRCTYLVTVVTPELTISKVASSTFVVPGGSVAYTIDIHNSGETPYVGATVSDPLVGILDDASFGGAATATAGTVTYDATTLTWTGDLAVGETATVTYAVTASTPASGDKTMVNPVSSTDVGSTCPPASGASACRSTVAVLTPALTTIVAMSPASTVPGATVTSTITTTNTGQVPFGAATVVLPMADVLDDADLVGATASSGTVSLVGSTLTWTGALAPGASTTTTVTVVVDADPAGDLLLAQRATSTTAGSTCPAGGTDPRCGAEVPVARLRITNVVDASFAAPTSVVRSTVTITNSGRVPYVDTTVGASFAGSLDDAAYNGDAAATSGDLTLVTGTGRIDWKGDLPVGATVTVTGSLTVLDPDPGDRIMATLVTTSVAGSNCPAAAPDASCRTSIPVLTPGLTITTAADATHTAPGGTVGYTLTITNAGETAYADAVVHQQLGGALDDATYGGGATATTGTMAFADASLRWTGDLAVGEIVIVRYQLVVDDPDLGDKVLAVTARSSALGSSCPTGGTDPSCSTFVAVLVPRIAITVVADEATTVPGATVRYVVSVRNDGQLGAAGIDVTVQLAGVLDDTGSVGQLLASVGTAAVDGTVVSWTGDLAVGATATVTYAVTVDDPDEGDRDLVTSASSTAPGSTCPAARPCTDTVTVLIPGLAVSTHADVATASPGDEVRFTTSVTNTGQTPHDAVTASSSLAGLVDDAELLGAATATSGTVTYDEPDLSWTGALAVGATATITYVVVVRAPGPGDRVLTSTVVAPAPGSSCPAGSPDPACTATVTVLVPQLALSVSAESATTTPGSTVDHTAVITNAGETAQEGASVTIDLSGALPDADYGADASATRGAVVYDAGTLTWTGDLPVGASASITWTVVVHDPDTGDKAMTTSIVSSAPGSSCPPNSPSPACSVVVQVLVPSLQITKSVDAASVAAGDTVTYVITLVNDGEVPLVPATFTDQLSDVLDDADHPVNVAATTGTATSDDLALTWTGALDVDEEAVITYDVTTRFPAEGDRRLLNTVVSSTAGSTCRTAADAGCSTTVTVLVPELEVVKTADVAEVVAGGVVAYTISATNTGESDQPAAVIVDLLAGVLDDATLVDGASATSGSLVVDGEVLTWTGGLVRGETVVIGYAVRARLDEVGDGTLLNRVTSAAIGSSCTTGAEPTCATSTPVLARSITISDLSSAFSLEGLPDTTVGAEGAVTLTVATNSPGGYLVTVQPTGASLTGSPGSDEAIPVDRLHVRESGTEDFSPLSADEAVVVHRQDEASSPQGDAVSNDYEVDVPFVAPDTYSITLDYIVSAQ